MNRISVRKIEMAEEFFDFFEANKSTDSFSEFEELWCKMGKELERSVVQPQHNIQSTQSLNCCTALSTIGRSDNDSLKRPLSPTPECHIECGSFTASVRCSPTPPLDSHCSGFTPVVNYSENDKGGFCEVEDSILTTLRRTNPEKISRLEKRMREPCRPELFKEQFEVLKTLLARVGKDCEQIRIIVNYMEGRLIKEEKSSKRVKFTTL